MPPEVAGEARDTVTIIERGIACFRYRDGIRRMQPRFLLSRDMAVQSSRE